jgi:ferredoxin-thioredoxin reductase catalytic subunit
MSRKKSERDVHAYVQKVAQRQGWKLVSQQDMLDDLVDGLMVNYNRFGYYNCPCRDSQQDANLDRDIICPCIYAREADVAEHGHCYCGLFFRQDADMSGDIAMIPERRPLQLR